MNQYEDGGNGLEKHRRGSNEHEISNIMPAGANAPLNTSAVSSLKDFIGQYQHPVTDPDAVAERSESPEQQQVEAREMLSKSKEFLRKSLSNQLRQSQMQKKAQEELNQSMEDDKKNGIVDTDSDKAANENSAE